MTFLQPILIYPNSNGRDVPRSFDHPFDYYNAYSSSSICLIFHLDSKDEPRTSNLIGKDPGEDDSNASIDSIMPFNLVAAIESHR